jgi:hypothetical protein
MENKLTIDIQQIVVVKGSIAFNGYETVKQQALDLAAQIAEVEVNEDNIKQSKKLLAAVNKRLKELEDKRISTKKEMLEPYQVFEDQVKEIVSIVKEADAQVRDQVKYLEEFERLQKEEAIKDKFYSRIWGYDLGIAELLHFEHFIQPRHLNKTTSLATIEKELVDFLERIQKDYEVIQLMPNAQDVLSAYIGHFDLSKALAHVQEQDRIKSRVEALGTIKQPTEDKIAFLVSVRVYSQKELKLLEMLLHENDFKFTTDKII